MTDWSSSRVPGEQAPPGLVTLTVVLRSQEVEDLEDQARVDNISVTDCIRRSLELGRIAWEEQRKGGRLLIQSSGGELRPIRFRSPAEPR